jgi:hypothetical protein
MEVSCRFKDIIVAWIRWWKEEPIIHQQLAFSAIEVAMLPDLSRIAGSPIFFAGLVIPRPSTYHLAGHYSKVLPHLTLCLTNFGFIAFIAGRRRSTPPDLCCRRFASLTALRLASIVSFHQRFNLVHNMFRRAFWFRIFVRVSSIHRLSDSISSQKWKSSKVGRVSLAVSQSRSASSLLSLLILLISQRILSPTLLGRVFVIGSRRISQIITR